MDDLVFKKGDKKINRLWVWRRIKSVMDHAELNPRYSPHTLRHRFIVKTYLASQKDLEFTRRQARHSSVVTTQKYMAIASMIEEADKALENFDVKL
jgi:site-specific recombinase XerD